VLERLNAIDGIKCLPSDGTFYAFPSVQGVIDRLDGINNDVEFASHLLETVGLALVPGSAFGSEGFVRISYAASMEHLQAALDRLEKACA
jgi:aspartate aminotransferase